MLCCDRASCLCRYPNMSAMIDTLHDLNIRVIFWITSMVDTDSPNYQEGYDSGYYIKYACIVSSPPCLSGHAGVRWAIPDR